MFESISSFSGATHVAWYSGFLMFAVAALMRTLGLLSERADDWFWEIMAGCFAALIFKYGQAWCLDAFHGYPSTGARLTNNEAWGHLVTAFWAGLGGGALGLFGWDLVVHRTRRA